MNDCSERPAKQTRPSRRVPPWSQKTLAAILERRHQPALDTRDAVHSATVRPQMQMPDKAPREIESASGRLT
jgi:hypothetical protein